MKAEAQTLFCAALTLVIAAVGVNGDGDRVVENLDRDGKFVAAWEVEFSTKIMIFQLTVETTGWIGLGLSVHGGMGGADIMIGGVGSNGKPYIGDFHGVGNTIPNRDVQQDWILLSGTENGTHTNLRIYRRLDTCDDEDVPITPDTMNVIWAYGLTDELQYHGGIRGSHVANLLDAVTIPDDPSSFKQWDILVDTPMPSTSFSYWCTIHRSPFHGKNHIVGFKPFVKAKEAIEHTHHFVIYKCEAPDHNNAIFEQFVGDAGGECYGEQEMATRPTQFCKNILYDWGAGGKELFLPEHVGFPVGEKETEYYMLEIHYNNPERVHNIQFTTGVSVVYTPNLRKYDAGMFTVGHTVLASLLLPPKSKDFVIVGHCSPGCTSRGVPPEGVDIFNVLLHTHLAGRKMKFRHFRGNKELEWIAKDDSYHFNFQKNRPLRQERKLLPGDQLTFECTYDTTGRPNVTIAGFSTANEMCEVFVWYYPKIPMLSCSSFYDITRLFPAFGIKKVKWVKGFNKDSQPMVLEPSHMANKTFAEYLDTEIDWSDERRGILQNELHYTPHISDCGSAKLPDAISTSTSFQNQYQHQQYANKIQPQISMPSNPQMPNQNSIYQNQQQNYKSQPQLQIQSQQQQQQQPHPNSLGTEMLPMPRPEFVTYPNAHDYKPDTACPQKQKRLYM